MRRRIPLVVVCGLAALSLLVLVDGVAARGGGGRGGGGLSRGGPAAGGSFRPNLPAGGVNRGAYNRRGPAAYGNLAWQNRRQGAWEDNRQDRFDQRQERREDLHEYAEDHYYDYDYGAPFYYGDYFGAPGGVADEAYYWTLPCRPTVMAMDGVTYYICGSAWFVRVYLEDGVAFTAVPNPNEY